MDFAALLRTAVESSATDIHLKLGRRPLLRISGEIVEVEGWLPLSDEDLESIVELLTVSKPERRVHFHTSGEMDIGWESAGVRFRINAFKQRGAISLACRVIQRESPTLESVHMPIGVRRLADEQRGLILVTGATGSGKSTTLAAMVDHINQTRSEHIITIEDPIEMLYADRNCIINQREVGLDTQSFAQALRRALRQDPDIIMIGELRDAETAETALQAAESGHLVLSTMHTVDGPETVGRMLDFFPAEKHAIVRSIMASSLKGVVSQRLLPKTNGGLVAAVEVMVVNERIAELIRESKTDGIPAAIADGTFYDMQTLTQSLIELTLSGSVEREIAANAAANRHDFLLQLSHAEKIRDANRSATEPSSSRAPVEGGAGAAETGRPEPIPAYLGLTSRRG